MNGHNKNIPDSSSLTGRLALCADKAGGKRALALAADISEAQLFRYINGESEMPVSRLQSVAKATQVDPGWLLTGSGSQEATVASRRPEFRPELMTEIVQTLTEALVDFEWRPAPKLRARFVTYMYEALRQEEILTGSHVAVTHEGMHEALWYFGKSSFDELLTIHQEAMGQDMNPAPRDPTWAWRFSNAVYQANLNYYNSPAGAAFLRRVGQRVTLPAATQRLTKMIESFRRHYKGAVNVLDVGCGNGREADFLGRLDPSLTMYGVEPAELAYQELQKIVAAHNWDTSRWVKADARVLPFPDHTFHLVYSRMMLPYLPYLPDHEEGVRAVFKEMTRVTKPGGYISSVVLHGKHRYWLPFLQPLSDGDIQTLASLNKLEIVGEESLTMIDGPEKLRNQKQFLFRKPLA